PPSCFQSLSLSCLQLVRATLFASVVSPLYYPLLALFVFFLILPRPPISTLFPYTTLFRSFTSASDTAAIATPSPSRACSESRRSDRKSTRLNSSHVEISYAVFCLKKKKKAQGDGLANKRERKERSRPLSTITRLTQTPGSP